jgi:hypothetical protein
MHITSLDTMTRQLILKRKVNNCNYTIVSKHSFLSEELIVTGYNNDSYVLFDSHKPRKQYELKDYQHEWDNNAHFNDCRKQKNGDIISLAKS